MPISSGYIHYDPDAELHYDEWGRIVDANGRWQDIEGYYVDEYHRRFNYFPCDICWRVCRSRGGLTLHRRACEERVERRIQEMIWEEEDRREEERGREEQRRRWEERMAEEERMEQERREEERRVEEMRREEERRQRESEQ
jgi:hypothetical protein